MSAPREEVINVEVVADPMPEIEYWRQASRRWRKLAIGSLAGLAVILLLSVTQFAATWMALAKLTKAQQEVAGLKSDLDSFMQGHLSASQRELAEFKKDARDSLDRVNAEVTPLKQSNDEKLRQLEHQAAKLEGERLKLEELASIFKSRESLAQNQKYLEFLQLELLGQLKQAKQEIEDARYEIKQLAELARQEKSSIEKRLPEASLIPKKP